MFIVLLTTVIALSFAVALLLEEMKRKDAALAAAQRAATEAMTPPPPQDPDVAIVEVSGGGCESFTDVLEQGRVYELIARGTFGFEGPGSWLKMTGSADALYRADEFKNYSQRYDGLCLNGKSIRTVNNFGEDRGAHEYSCMLEGHGKRVALMIKHSTGVSPTWGQIDVTLRRLPVSTPLLSDAAREAAEAELAALERENRRLKQAAKRAEDGERARRIAVLRRHVHQHRNFLDPGFCAKFLKTHFHELTSYLPKQWTEEYDEIFRDEELVGALQAAAPEVLNWHESRMNLLLAAERGTVVPVPPPPPSPSLPPPPQPLQVIVGARQVTASTLPFVEQALSELFAFTEQLDHERRLLAVDHNEPAHRRTMERAVAAIAFYYQELARFGIHASTPEQAEVQFFELCPPPAPSYYEELMADLRAGKSVPPNAICERLEDLQREKIILRAKRRSMIRRGRDEGRTAIDNRLGEIRREATEVQAFLESIRCPFELSDPRQQEHEVSLEEQLMSLYAGKKRIIEFLQQEGEQNQLEAIEALYAQEQAKLFEGDAASYA